MTTFAEIGVRGDILKGLDAMGFEEPTQVQTEIIPVLLRQRQDLVGLAQTGTGKTAAFGIPLIQGIDAGNQNTQALVLCPTRELCVQVTGDLCALGRFVKGVKIVAVYGGASIERQITSLRKGAHIIVATPGRLQDLMRRGRAELAGVGSVVLDEADEMLQMGFQDELNAILAATPADKNTLLFSATMPREVETISRKYMHDPLEITIGRRNGGVENVRHVYYMIRPRDRYPAMRRVIDIHPNIYGIVFCRTRKETQEVADQLIQDGYAAEALHGDMSQGQRDQVMNKFRRRDLQLLVATDVAARGIDINDLSHVINYNLPEDAAAYTHRSGRTGRAGKSGTSIAFIHSREMHKLNLIERKLQRKFEEGRIPSGAEICGRRLAGFIDAVKDFDVHHDQIAPFMEELTGQLASLDRHELIARFVSHSFHRLLESYRQAPDLNVATASKGRAKTGKKNISMKRQPSSRLQMLHLNVGRKDGIYAKRLIGQINEACGPNDIRIGKIEIMNSSTLLEADSSSATRVIGALNGLMINGKPVIIKVAREGSRKPGGCSGRKCTQALKKANPAKSGKSKKKAARTRRWTDGSRQAVAA